MTPQRIYLDNAATSWPKPECVYAAVDAYQRKIGAAAGRGGYQEAQEADRIVARARAGVAQLIGAVDPRCIVFTTSGTDSLNLAIHGVLCPGDHVVTTVCEHNSVLRPLSEWIDRRQVEVTYVPCDREGFVKPDDVQQAIRPHTKLVAVIHASNVTGAIQPIADIGRVVAEHGALLLVDAAQTLGHVELNVQAASIDLLAAPGHKGLLAPLGTGVLYVRPGLETVLKPQRQGGTGSRSESDRQPEQMPDRFESGNHNLLGLAGLADAVHFLLRETVEGLAAQARSLCGQLIQGLSQIGGVRLYGPANVADRVSVVSVTVEGYDSQEIAGLLEASYAVQCRAGLHCAPRMHRALSTIDTGGTVRLSPGWATSSQDVQTVLSAFEKICAVPSGRDPGRQIPLSP